MTRCFIPLVSSVLLLACTAASAMDDAAVVETAKREVAAGAYQSAAQRLERLLAEKPASPARNQTLLWLCRASLKLGKRDIAAHRLKEFLAEYPADPERPWLEPELLMLERTFLPEGPAELPPSVPGREVARAVTTPSAPPVQEESMTPTVADPVPAPPGEIEEAPLSVPDAVKFAGAVTTDDPAEDPLPAPFTLYLRDYVDAAEVKELRAQLRKEGFAAVSRKGGVRMAPMVRLFVGEYREKSAALAALVRLRREAPGAFVIRDGTSFTLYGGSFFIDERAAKEQRRLAKRGIKTEIRAAQAPVTVWRLLAGAYTSEPEARRGADLLASKGIRAVAIGID